MRVTCCLNIHIYFWFFLVDLQKPLVVFQQLLSYNCFLRDDTVSAVGDAQEALDEAKQELQRARQVRSHGLQYHALAKLIQEHPPRSPTAEKLSKLSTNLANLKVILVKFSFDIL